MSNPESAGGDGGTRVDRFGDNPSAKSMVRFIRPALWGLLVLYVAALLLLNRDPTKVDFLFFTATVPLVIALLITFVLGVLVGGGLLMMRSRRQARKG